MARRRYLSTRISVDSAVNRLATMAGDFGVLLYTWLIPHAADDATFPRDAEELLLTVMPGRRDKAAADVQAALEAMLRLGLIEEVDAGRYGFPTEPFYRYQSYVKDGARRESAAPAAAHIKERTTAENTGNLRSPAIVAENAVSVPSPVNVSSSPPLTPPKVATKPRPASQAVAGEPKPKPTAGKDTVKGAAPNKVGQVIDLIRAGGGQVATTDRDAGAVKQCSGTAEEIAAGYLAVLAGTWGDPWLRENLSLHAVCDRLSGFLQRLRGKGAAPPTVSNNGQLTRFELEELEKREGPFAPIPMPEYLRPLVKGADELNA